MDTQALEQAKRQPPLVTTALPMISFTGTMNIKTDGASKLPEESKHTRWALYSDYMTYPGSVSMISSE